MFLNSIKEINRLRKEINRLLCKRMSSIYLKLATSKTWTRTPDPDPGPWTRTLKNLEPEKPGL